jgi:hypothetical protein
LPTLRELNCSVFWASKKRFFPPLKAPRTGDVPLVQPPS